MTRLLLIAGVVVWLAALSGCAAPSTVRSGAISEGNASSILSLPHESFRLDNGLSVYFIRYPSPSVVAYQIAVHAGSRNEIEVGKTGFAHFFEHLMFRGTKHRSGKEFGDLYARLGAENNARTDDDETVFHGMVTPDALPQILQAESDRFENLSFDEKALRDEAGAVLGEYNKDVADPDFQLEEKLYATAFSVHPYGHTTMGYKADVLNLGERFQDVWPFFRRYYRPANVSVILVGDFDFQKAKSLVETDFGGWKNPSSPPVVIPTEPIQKAERTAFLQLGKSTQTRISVAYKVPAFSTKNEEYAALELIAEMYFSKTSQFQKEYLFDKRWVDSVDAGVSPSVDPGLWTIEVRLSQQGEGHEKELVAAVEKQIAEIGSGPIDPNRLARTKARLRNQSLIGWFGSPEDLASELTVYTNLEPDMDVLDRVIERMEDASPNSLQKFATDHLNPTQETVVTLKGTKA